MKMKIQLLHICYLLGGLASFWLNAQQINYQQLTENTYSLSGKGGNIGVFISDDVVYVIDSQFADMSPAILQTIASFTTKPIRFLINTHWHGDHVGGNSNFAAIGSSIIAHQNVYKRLLNRHFDSLGKPKGALQKNILPKITFTHQLELQADINRPILIFHVENAHTDGDSILYSSADNVLHMGDVFFNGRYPYIDISSGGSIDGMIQGINRALVLCDDATVIIPGHGPIGTPSDLKEHRDMLVKIRKRIFNAIQEGKTLSETQDLSPTKEWDQTHGQHFIQADQLVGAIYKSLQSSL